MQSPWDFLHLPTQKHCCGKNLSSNMSFHILFCLVPLYFSGAGSLPRQLSQQCNEHFAHSTTRCEILTDATVPLPLSQVANEHWLFHGFLSSTAEAVSVACWSFADPPCQDIRHKRRFHLRGWLSAAAFTGTWRSFRQWDLLHWV